MRLYRRLVLGVLVFAFISLGLPAAGRASSIVLDYSAVDNPNGPWSYGYTTLLGGVFNLYTGQGGFYDEWNVSGGIGSFPMVAHNSSGITQLFYGTAVVPTDVLLMHPGPSGQQSIVRWTAQTAGTYSIQGLFAGLDPQGPTTSTDVHILLNSSTGAQLVNGSIVGVLTPVNFNVTTALAPGDTIDFVVGYGNGSFEFDSTGLRGTIAAVPEPGSLVLLGVGVCGLAAQARRRRTSSESTHR